MKMILLLSETVVHRVVEEMERGGRGAQQLWRRHVQEGRLRHRDTDNSFLDQNRVQTLPFQGQTGPRLDRYEINSSIILYGLS